MRRASLPARNLSPAVPMAPALEPQPAGMASRPTRLRRAHPRYRTAHLPVFTRALRLLSLVGKVFGRRVALPGCLPVRGAGTGRGVAGQANPHCRRREHRGGLPTRERHGSPSPRGALPRDLNGRLFPRTHRGPTRETRLWPRSCTWPGVRRWDATTPDRPPPARRSGRCAGRRAHPFLWSLPGSNRRPLRCHRSALPS